MAQPAQLGFLGLGIMGYRMAGHLLKAGHDVALWSHTGSKAQQLAKSGKGTACATPREVAERSDVIFYCVGDTKPFERMPSSAIAVPSLPMPASS